MLSIQTPRILALVVMLCGTFIAGTIPILIIRKLKKGPQSIGPDGKICISRRNSIIISFLVCFGGGVLFATCFIHLLPEVREALDYPSQLTNITLRHGIETPENKGHHQFPLAEMLVCGGFFLVYLIEELLHAAIHHVHTKKAASSPDCSEIVHGHSHSPAVLVCTLVRPGETNQPLNHNPNVVIKHIPKGFDTNDEIESENPAETETRTELHIAGTEGTTQYGSVATEPVKSSGGHSHGPEGKVPLSIKGLLIVVALSFHSVFEGMAIGLQTTDKDVWTMFTAVALHKFVLAFAIGLDVCKNGTRVVVVIAYMTIFSLMSPVGILVGLGMESATSGSGNMLVAYLTSLATGTLLYVTFFEVLQSEKNSDTPGLLQFFAIILGFGLMLMITLIFPA